VSERLAAWLPNWAQPLAGWMLQPWVLTLLLIGSALLFVLSLIGLPLVLTRMPADFFSRPERRRLALADRKRPIWFMVLIVARNILGAVLLVLGVLMLFLPGQGLLAIFAALFLLDFPGKRRLQRWIISRPAVHRPVNALRRRAGRAPLELPQKPPS
jgi:multisubunit Na+/H+ antiporter MnhG subunit